MGHERWYVAIPDESRLLARAMADPEFGENLEVPSYLGPQRRGYPRGGPAAEFRAEVDAMNRAHPGIEDRIYTLDRYYDILHYLLSEERRRGEFDGADWGTTAIRGGHPLPEHLRGTQGHPTRSSTPGQVREVAARLTGLTADDLRAAYSTAGMQRQGVYKYQADRNDGETWGWIVRYFEGLRSFYAATAAHGEGVLAIVT